VSQKSLTEMNDLENKVRHLISEVLIDIDEKDIRLDSSPSSTPHY